MDEPYKPTGQMRERLAAANLLMLFEDAARREDAAAMAELLSKTGAISVTDELSRKVLTMVMEKVLARSRTQKTP